MLKAELSIFQQIKLYFKTNYRDSNTKVIREDDGAFSVLLTIKDTQYLVEITHETIVETLKDRELKTKTLALVIDVFETAIAEDVFD